ncbi:hypothetical protein QL285_086908 [Trifolium repens]|nr:hypothetical protein QL285_086908 [Trifolium repens]
MTCHPVELLSPSDAVVSPSIIGVATSGRLSNMVIIAIGFMEKSSLPLSDFVEKLSSSPSNSWRNRRRRRRISWRNRHHHYRIHGEIGVAAVRFVKDTPARHRIHTRDVFHRKCRNLLDTKRVREKIGKKSRKKISRLPTSSPIHGGMDYLSFKDYAWNQVKLSTFLQSAFW